VVGAALVGLGELGLKGIVSRRRKLALPLRALAGLDQVEKPRSARGAAGWYQHARQASHLC
jgi:hypothetical protein